MKGDAKVVEYLNQGLRHELTAVNQFWLHYRLFDHWGYNELAKKWRKESIEEMEHADRFVDRILFLERSGGDRVRSRGRVRGAGALPGSGSVL